MADFMIHELAWYPWLAWPIAFLVAVGIVYGCLWVSGAVVFVSEWMGYRRAVWASKAAVQRRLNDAPCVVCELAEEEISELEREAGPPEYQHPDGDDDPLPEPDEDAVEAFLAAVKAMGLLDEGEERAGPPVCEDPECDKYGWVHPPPCLILPTLPVPKYRDGPAMPPQPWSGLEQALPLLPAVREHLEAAGFGGHEYVEDVAESAFTKAQAAEVQARMRELER